MKINQPDQSRTNQSNLYSTSKSKKSDSIEDILIRDSCQIGSDEEITEPVTINFLYDKKLTSLKIDVDGNKEICSMEAPGPKAVGNDPPMKVSVLRNGKWVDSGEKMIAGKNIAIMVHGFGGDSGDLLDMANNIQKEQNFDEIIAVDYNKGYHIDDISKKLTKIVNTKIPADSELTIVSHSMGGLVSRGAIENYGLADRVKKFIALGTPHQGVRPAVFYSHIPGSSPEYYDMSPGSKFLNGINDSKPVSTKYYSMIGTEGKHLTKYWTVKYLGEGIMNAILGDKDNDGLVPSKSSGYDLMKECSEWNYKKFPVNHTYLHGGGTLGGTVFEDTYKQVNAWIKE